MAIHRLCSYHDSDGEERGWKIEQHGGPSKTCSACRRIYFTADERAALEAGDLEMQERASRVVKVRRATLKIIPTGDNSSTYSMQYRVELISGRWPGKEAIRLACEENRFGGHVMIAGKAAMVDCFRD